MMRVLVIKYLMICKLDTSDLLTQTIFSIHRLSHSIAYSIKRLSRARISYTHQRTTVIKKIALDVTGTTR